MVMFKAKFRPMASGGDKPGMTGRPRAAQQQQQPQPERQPPPIEKERGPQHPVKEPGPGDPPQRAR